MEHRSIQQRQEFQRRVCERIDKQIPLLRWKHLCAALECRCVEGSWLVWVPQKVVIRSNENWQFLSGHRVQSHVTQMEYFQNFWLIIFYTQAFPQTKDGHMPQYQYRNRHMSVIRLHAHSCQKVRAQHVSHDVYNIGCNELFVVLFLDRDCEVQDIFQNIHKLFVAARSFCHSIHKAAQFDPFSLAIWHLLFAKNATNQNELLVSTYVALHMQLSHHLQAMTLV